jgi:hypothetical protein
MGFLQNDPQTGAKALHRCGQTMEVQAFLAERNAGGSRDSGASELYACVVVEVDGQF